jgi:hypothetical protein
MLLSIEEGNCYARNGGGRTKKKFKPARWRESHGSSASLSRWHDAGTRKRERDKKKANNTSASSRLAFMMEVFIWPVSGVFAIEPCSFLERSFACGI